MKEQIYNALTVNTVTGEHKVFLQDGFYYTGFAASNIHEHNYAEIHLIFLGDAEMTVAGESFLQKSGSMLVIPRKVFHSCERKDEGAMHCAFQIDCEPEAYGVYELETSIVSELFELIAHTSPTDDHSMIAAYISLLCTKFETEKKLLPKSLNDYGFLIFEFFSMNYALDVHLCDLAEFLHLSERQAERLVHEHTGHCFRDELAKTRVRIATQLMQTTKMSLSEVAEYTGYRSYAGLWKAMKKYT